MAFLIPLLVVIIGATISFGLFFFQANVMQQAVDVAAMEIARMPFDPEAQLGLGVLDADASTLLWDSGPDGTRFRRQIYDPKFLVVHDAEWDEGTEFNGNLLDYASTWPLLNRLLVTVMVRDATYPADDDPDTAVTRFPGAVVTYPNPDSQGTEETVLIPIVSYDANTAGETIIRFVAPVEEIRPGNGEGPFSLSASNAANSFVPGMVALRINYPAQSTTLINRTGTRSGGRVVGVNVVQATAPTIGSEANAQNYTLAVNSDERGTYSGTYGLGKGETWLYPENGVRPYRKVLSVQAIYRREVFR